MPDRQASSGGPSGYVALFQALTRRSSRRARLAQSLSCPAGRQVTDVCGRYDIQRRRRPAPSLDPRTSTCRGPRPDKPVIRPVAREKFHPGPAQGRIRPWHRAPEWKTPQLSAS